MGCSGGGGDVSGAWLRVDSGGDFRGSVWAAFGGGVFGGGCVWVA